MDGEALETSSGYDDDGTSEVTLQEAPLYPYLGCMNMTCPTDCCAHLPIMKPSGVQSSKMIPCTRGGRQDRLTYCAQLPASAPAACL